MDNLHKGANSLFNKKIKKLDSEINSSSNIKKINEESMQLINKDGFIDKIMNIDKLDLDINKNNAFINLNTQIKIKPILKVSSKIIQNEWILKIDDIKVEINSAPLGVKKLILFYFQIVEEFNKPTQPNKKIPKLLILKEVENFLHPSWIKMCVTLIKNIISKCTEGNDRILISTCNLK